MPDAPRADAWKLLAKIAANPAAFAASGAVASATGASILRNQLLHGVMSISQLTELSAIVGEEALSAAIHVLAGFEIQHVLTNISAGGRSNGALECEAARRLLLGLAAGIDTFPMTAAAQAPKPAMRTLRRHYFSGASRQRDRNLQPPS